MLTWCILRKIEENTGIFKGKNNRVYVYTNKEKGPSFSSRKTCLLYLTPCLIKGRDFSDDNLFSRLPNHVDTVRTADVHSANSHYLKITFIRPLHRRCHINKRFSRLCIFNRLLLREAASYLTFEPPVFTFKIFL